VRKRLTKRTAKRKRLTAQDDIILEEEIDPRFVEKVRTLKRALPKLTSKRNKKLRQYGVETIRGNNTVEDLIDALMRITQS
jgi:hypothetical protein